MSELIKHVAREQGLKAVEPRMEINIRRATQDDFAWIDALQKAESDKVGFMWEQAIRKRINDGDVIVAEAATMEVTRGETNASEGSACHLSPDTCHFVPAGYCLGVDRYMKRGDVGIIYQMCVAREFRRSLVAATLLQAQFDKSAYGCRLYCCWCKQSLEANRFWEAMGFVPLAFRAGPRKKTGKVRGEKRHVVHIFWQKRVRAGDVGDPASGGTPYWYPYETSGGAMMEGRVVLPLPPEVQWYEATPVVLPGSQRREAEQRLLEEQVTQAQEHEREAKRKVRKASRADASSSGHSPANACGAMEAPRAVGAGGFGLGVEPGFDPEAPQVKQAAQAKEAQASAQAELEAQRLREQKAAAKKALKAAQRKNDPQLVAYARELRDRWQELVGAKPMLIEGKANARYAVGRLIDRPSGGGDAQPREGCTLVIREGDEGGGGGVERGSEAMIPEARRLKAA